MELLAFYFAGAEWHDHVAQQTDEVIDWAKPYNAFVAQVGLNRQLFSAADVEYEELDTRGREFLSGMADVLNRDHHAFKQSGQNEEPFTVDTYVVVLLVYGEYYGHIYTWLSPADPELCLAVGIRTRVDNSRLKGTRKEVRNISALLLEGVRRFAVFKSCTQMCVVNPINIMHTIIDKLPFDKEYHHIKDVELGMSPLGFYGGLCSRKCTNVDAAIDKRKVYFRFIRTRPPPLTQIGV